MIGQYSFKYEPLKFFYFALDFSFILQAVLVGFSTVVTAIDAVLSAAPESSQYDISVPLGFSVKAYALWIVGVHHRHLIDHRTE